jgi:hypothetical protein
MPLFFLRILRQVEGAFFWKVIALVDSQVSLREYAASFSRIFAPDSWSQLEERAL